MACAAAITFRCRSQKKNTYITLEPDNHPALQRPLIVRSLFSSPRLHPPAAIWTHQGDPSSPPRTIHVEGKRPTPARTSAQDAHARIPTCLRRVARSGLMSLSVNSNTRTAAAAAVLSLALRAAPVLTSSLAAITSLDSSSAWTGGQLYVCLRRGGGLGQVGSSRWGEHQVMEWLKNTKNCVWLFVTSPGNPIGLWELGAGKDGQRAYPPAHRTRARALRPCRKKKSHTVGHEKRHDGQTFNMDEATKTALILTTATLSPLDLQPQTQQAHLSTKGLARHCPGGRVHSVGLP